MRVRSTISAAFGPALVTMAAAALVLPSAARADTITMSATYYTIAADDVDMGHLASGVFNNEVQSTLGTDGLPILNTATYGCSSNCFTNSPFPADLTASGEITWWSPSLNKNVTETTTGTITTPYSNGSFYPPNGTGPNDANGFQAAIFSTVLDVPTSENISFNVGADDVAFVYLDGSIVCDLGGVHGDAPGTCDFQYSYRRRPHARAVLCGYRTNRGSADVRRYDSGYYRCSYSSSSRSAAFCLRPRCLGFFWMAQKAQGRGCCRNRLIKIPVEFRKDDRAAGRVKCQRLRFSGASFSLFRDGQRKGLDAHAGPLLQLSVSTSCRATVSINSSEFLTKIF